MINKYIKNYNGKDYMLLEDAKKLVKKYPNKYKIDQFFNDKELEKEINRLPVGNQKRKKYERQIGRKKLLKYLGEGVYDTICVIPNEKQLKKLQQKEKQENLYNMNL